MRDKAEYILHRLAEVGVHHMFGAPTYYNLRFLYYAIEYKRITWAGVHRLTRLMKETVTCG